MNPLSTSDIPKLVKAPRKMPRYIKNGRRMMQTDTGFMYADSAMSKNMFGKMKGGKYSMKYV